MLRLCCALLVAVLAAPATASAAGTAFSVADPLVAGGAAVATSQDGSMVVVGDSTIGFPGGNGSNVGAIQVLARSGTTWKATPEIYQQPNQQHSDNHFGASVAISPDGSVVVAGAPEGENNNGQRSRVEVFTIALDGGGTPVATRIAVLSSSSVGHFGASVAVTHVAGHTTVAVGAPDASPFIDGAFRTAAGEVFEFTDPVSEVFPGGLGDVSGTELFDATADGTANGALGKSVAITPDGGTIVAGAPHRGAQFHMGAVDVFTRSAGTYTGSQVLAGQIPGGNLGTSVAVSGDGSTAIAGEPMLDVFPKTTGAAHVLSLGAATGCAAALPSTLTPADGGHPGDAFGTSVSLSHDGRSALVGAPYAGFSPGTPFGSSGQPGSAYVEDARPGGAPAEQVLVPAGSDNGSYFGQAVALAGDGLTGLVGGPGDQSRHAGTFSFGWAFSISRTSRPDPCAAAPTPTPTPTPTQPPAPTPVPPVTSPAAQLAVACSGRRLTLLDVVARKGRVALLGAADAALIGHRVNILYDNRAAAASATVGADGFFRATAKLPPKAVRATNHARYVAVSGADRSLFLKLTRRVTLDPPAAKAGKVTLTGRVLPPLTAPRAPVVVRQQTGCGTAKTVARVRPGASGRFRIVVAAPKGAKAAIYRLATQVRKTRHNSKRFPSFSLPQVVGLGA